MLRFEISSIFVQSPFCKRLRKELDTYTSMKKCFFGLWWGSGIVKVNVESSNIYLLNQSFRRILGDKQKKDTIYIFRLLDINPNFLTVNLAPTVANECHRYSETFDRK